jgi:5-methylcytosine-specific restriction endonuclease McrA
MGAVLFWVVLAVMFVSSVRRIRRYRLVPPWRRPRGRPPIPPWVRRAVYARDGWRCRWCGSPYELQVDHMYPRSRGGPDSIGNYQTLCRPCNLAKGAAVMRNPQVAPWTSGEWIA